ncbi:HlyD family efflux transporter periplasmic adaptor subunit [Acinetobacter sp. ANC 4648]|uniref:HlyD family efflux transporter periplasmic adaptor subunit n=1 Tax=Acinetobacter sp. ANC 4648 TaxID=1977875 RepID=UPI000A334074|nr:HlyD family efflux transporter periplasmic adaptor subunit [Acinetobacter sp. ANC 4648]OTG80319.1 hypothetical protein B9T27_13195 [Acinetobacter sp. ANC 4648]
MKKLVIAGIVIIILLIAGFFIWQYYKKESSDNVLTLYGNIDIRQVSLAFSEVGRIQYLNVQEGDQVKKDQILGQLDTTVLQFQAAQAKAQVDVQQQIILEQKIGARPEEITQARAQLNSAEASLLKAQEDYSRLQILDKNTEGKALSKQELDLVKSNQRASEAAVKERKANLDLILKGARKEDRNAAVAQYNALKANLELLEYRVAQGILRSPVDAIVRARLQEPGDMTNPQNAVYTLALISPKWARIYPDESDLGRIQMGMQAQVYNDTKPDQPISGKVGYISSVAEFTPKTVQTDELRTHLVYEVRVYLNDSVDQLKMGQPITVKINAPLKSD